MLVGIIRAALWDMSMPQIGMLLASKPRILFIAATDGRYGGAMAVGDSIESVGASALNLDIKTPLSDWKDQIEVFRPTMIIGYPSAIKILSSLVAEKQISMQVSRVVSCGEPLGASLRQTIEAAFHARVINFYGASESLCLGVESETTGIYQVKRKDCVYTDASRLEAYADDGSFRELPVSFWYPAEVPGPRSCPLVVFSHGSFGVKESNETLYRELASYGYVVCSIDHTYHSFSAKLSNGKTVRVSGAYMKELTVVSPQDKPEQALPRFEKWMALRMGDINFVLDTVIERVSKESGELSVYGLIDPYIDYQPWITFIYIAIFLGPVIGFLFAR